MFQAVSVVIGVNSERMRNIYAEDTLMAVEYFRISVKVELTFCSLKMDQDEYIQALEANLLDYSIEHNDRTWKFHHDNAPIYCSNRVKQFLSRNLIEIMYFYSYSPDLNSIKNIWSSIVRIIHESGRQFHCIDGLKGAILATWSAISLTYFQRLVSSMNIYKNLYF